MIAGEHEAFILSLGDDCAVFFVIDPLYGLENRLEKGERGESVRKRRRVASRAFGRWGMFTPAVRRYRYALEFRIYPIIFADNDRDYGGEKKW